MQFESYASLSFRQKLNKQIDPVKLEQKQSNAVAFVVW